MARVGRLAGALLVETLDAGTPTWFLVGDTKVPCDWPAAGFVAPADRDVVRQRYVRLVPIGDPVLEGTMLAIELEGEAAARAIAERLTIDRTGSVSERLWRLVLGEDEAEDPSGARIEAAWLCAMPSPVWNVVRESVLKCS
jgi:hypothetical protein